MKLKTAKIRLPPMPQGGCVDPKQTLDLAPAGGPDVILPLLKSKTVTQRPNPMTLPERTKPEAFDVVSPPPVVESEMFPSDPLPSEVVVVSAAVVVLAALVVLGAVVVVVGVTHRVEFATYM